MLTMPSSMIECEPIWLSVDAMATRFELVLYGDGKSQLRAAGEEALEEIVWLDRQLSRYRPDSDISWINAHAAEGPIKVEPRLFHLLERARELNQATFGAFDITVGSLMRAWGFINGGGNVPNSSEFEAARELVGMEHIELNPRDFTIHFRKGGMEIDLGAIGKGYAIERAADLLRANGVTSGIIHGGTSTVYAIGTPPDGNAWKIAIRHPSSGEMLKVAKLHDSSLSVSGTHGKSFAVGVKEFGHIIDPRTGEPADAAILAAVQGPSSTDTDALSTAMIVLGESGKHILCELFSL